MGECGSVGVTLEAGENIVCPAGYEVSSVGSAQDMYSEGGRIKSCTMPDFFTCLQRVLAGQRFAS